MLRWLYETTLSFTTSMHFTRSCALHLVLKLIMLDVNKTIYAAEELVELVWV